jgi:tetratricopeptide (TPR) repeat protein
MGDGVVPSQAKGQFMDIVVSPVLLRASHLASGPVKRKVGRATVRARVAWSVARQARGRGIQIRRRTLHGWLARPDTQQQLQLGSGVSVSTAVDHLAGLLPGDTVGASRDAETVLFLVLAQFLRAQDQEAATVLAHDWQVQHTQAEGRATREAVEASGRSILERFSVSEMFLEQVRNLHPWPREQAVRIRDSWPTIEQVVPMIVAASDRGALLRQWVEQPPNWLAEAPADVACWLAGLSADHGQRAAAAQFLATGLARGAFPAEYWQARRAVCLLEDDPAEAERILESAQDQHPLARCLLAMHRQSWQEAIDAVSTWIPDSPGDLALKRQILVRTTVQGGDLNKSIMQALEAAEVQDASSAAVLAAKLLLSRAQSGQTVHRLADADQAATLATRARNARRTWQQDSVDAVLVVVQAAMLGGNLIRAWALTQPLPGGEATQVEAADPRLRRLAAHLAARTGRFDQARAASKGLDDPFIEAEITALEHATQGKTSEAIKAWTSALHHACAAADTLAAAVALAELGAPVPVLGDLEQTHPEAVREIRVVQRAMAADGESLEALRAGAGESPILTLKLAELHHDRGEHRMAATVLEDGAKRWDQPGMLLRAARHYLEAGDQETARGTAEAALTMAGTGWSGEFDARAFLLTMHDAAGDWEQTTQQARRLVTLDPHDPDARWALVHCLVRRGQLEDAWNELTPEGDPMPPRDRRDARTWISLATRHDTSPQFVSRALGTMRCWQDDGELTGIFIAQLNLALCRKEFTPAAGDLAALHAATAEYSERFPDSTTFQARLAPEEDPLKALIPQRRERHESLKDVAGQVRDGLLPLGLLAEAAGRSYAEASLQRAAGSVRCHDPAQQTQGREAVATALNGSVIIDTTAAHTLTLLDADTRSHLLAVFGQILATDPAYRDARQGCEALGLRSTRTLGWDPVADQPQVTTTDESEVATLADRAEQLCTILQGAVRRPWPRLETLKDLPGEPEWLASLDMAATNGLPYWCDDAVLRPLATELGVIAFDTVDLLRHLAAKGRLGHDILPVTEATLLRNYYTDLGFDRAALELAATMDGWAPRGAAFAITRHGAWTNPPAVMEFVFTAVKSCADDSLEDLEGWVTAAAVGLVRIAPGEDTASANLRILLGNCLAQPWMRPDRLPSVFCAARVAMKERLGTTDPVEPILTETHRALVAKHGHVLAAHLLMGMVQSASEPDRRMAARVVLVHQG